MTGHFLPPKNDVVFRLLFGDKRNGDLLCDFLKSVLTLPDDDFSEITIVDFVLIPESPHYHHRFTFYDSASAIEFTDLIEIHTLELPKLPETADNYVWHWLRFLRAESKEDLDMVAQASPNL
jgi:hypothetical protein